MRSSKMFLACAVVTLTSPAYPAPMPLIDPGRDTKPAIIKVQSAERCGVCRRGCYAQYQARLRILCRSGSTYCIESMVRRLNSCLESRCGTRPPGACAGF